jgi:hypothetical protein
MHRETPQDVMEGLSPLGRPSTVQDITDAVLYLTDAATLRVTSSTSMAARISAAGSGKELSS